MVFESVMRPVDSIGFINNLPVCVTKVTLLACTLILDTSLSFIVN